MSWQDYLHSDPEVLLGKPVVKGTRLSVEFLLGLFAAGWTQEQVLENYPSITLEALHGLRESYVGEGLVPSLAP